MNPTRLPEAALAERLRSALPQAFASAFGIPFTGCRLEQQQLEALLQSLQDEYQVHLELEASIGPRAAEPVLLALSLASAAPLFGVPAASMDQMSSPDRQLQLLAELSEGTETLAQSLSRELSTGRSFFGLRVSGASLVEPSEPPNEATAAQLREMVGFLVHLVRENGAETTLVLGIASALAAPLDSSEAGDAHSPNDAPSPAAAGRSSWQAAEGSMQSDRGGQGRPSARPFPFEQLDAGEQGAARALNGFEPILDVTLRLSVELGSVAMTVEEVLALGAGAVVELDRLAGEPVDVVVNDRVIARGEVVVVDDNFGVRILEIISGRRFSAA